MNNEFSKLISYLMHSRTQTHILHLQTPSFAAHMALNTYYDGIVPLIDGLVEAYQGKYGVLTGYSNFNLLEYKSCEDIIMYLEGLNMTIEKLRQAIPQDSYLQNQVDTVVELVSSTIYKLKFLK
jgi:hypothetical protein